MGTQILSSLPYSVIFLLSIAGAGAAFWLILSKLRSRSSLPSIIRFLASALLSILVFFAMFYLMAFLFYITNGRWCEGCQEFH